MRFYLSGVFVTLLTTFSVASPLRTARTEFGRVAQVVAGLRGEKVIELREIDLDNDRRPEYVATLCDDGPTFGTHAALLLQKDAEHRWLMVFAELDGRSEIGGCGAEAPAAVWWETGKARSLTVTQGHHGGYDAWTIAMRRGQPVPIRYQSLEDLRAGDRVVTKNWDRAPYHAACACSRQHRLRES